MLQRSLLIGFLALMFVGIFFVGPLVYFSRQERSNTLLSSGMLLLITISFFAPTEHTTDPMTRVVWNQTCYIVKFYFVLSARDHKVKL